MNVMGFKFSALFLGISGDLQHVNQLKLFCHSLHCFANAALSFEERLMSLLPVTEATASFTFFQANFSVISQKRTRRKVIRRITQTGLPSPLRGILLLPIEGGSGSLCHDESDPLLAVFIPLLTCLARSFACSGLSPNAHDRASGYLMFKLSKMLMM